VVDREDHRLALLQPTISPRDCARGPAGFRKTRHRGLARVDWVFTLTITAYNLIRL
jgi:hypothetical protein